MKSSSNKPISVKLPLKKRPIKGSLFYLAVTILIAIGVGFGFYKYLYSSYIALDEVLEMSYKGKKITPGDKLQKTSIIDFVLGDGEGSLKRKFDKK